MMTITEQLQAEIGTAQAKIASIRKGSQDRTLTDSENSSVDRLVGYIQGLNAALAIVAYPEMVGELSY